MVMILKFWMRDEKSWKGPTWAVPVEIDGSTSTPWKTNMTMEKQLFEDVYPIKN